MTSALSELCQDLWTFSFGVFILKALFFHTVYSLSKMRSPSFFFSTTSDRDLIATAWKTKPYQHEFFPTHFISHLQDERGNANGFSKKELNEIWWIKKGQVDYLASSPSWHHLIVLIIQAQMLPSDSLIPKHVNWYDDLNLVSPSVRQLQKT